MPTKSRSTLAGKKPAAAKKVMPKKQAAVKKPLPEKKKAAPVKTLPVDTLKKTIAYFYLLSYCPPGQIANFMRSTEAMRKALAKSAGMSETAYFKAALPEVCRRIVAFSQASREPGQDWVQALVAAAGEADQSPEKTLDFQVLMSKIARLPQRARPEGRLHRKKGCQLCRFPCHYGYFTLVSDPQFAGLQQMLAAEAQKSAAEQSPLTPAYGFTFQHLSRLSGSQQIFIHLEHLVHLSYCLLMLGMAKSRLALPEEQLRLFQMANQEVIRRAGAGR